MRELARLLSGPRAVLVSVAFASRSRRSWFQAQCHTLALQCHTHLLGEGDPAEGHEVRWLFLAGRELPAPYTPSTLTSSLLGRLARGGSFHDEAEDGGPAWDSLVEAEAGAL